MATGLYRGYSSFEFQRTKEFKIIDVELVKLDLLNHIFTTRGSRVMMSTYGSSIPRLLFEPLDEDMLGRLEEELRNIFESDPRVRLITLDVQSDLNQQTATVVAKLEYIELNVIEDFELNLEFEA